MNGRSMLTDARLREALTPAADATAPAALLERAFEVVSRTRQRRFIFRLPWGSDVGAGLRLVPSPVLVPLVGAVIILALLGMALVAGRLPRLERAITPPLPVTGPTWEVLGTSWDEAYAVAGDARTRLWHFQRGSWEELDPIGGSINSIVALPGGSLAAATSSGVFVYGSGGWSATPLTADISQIAVSPDGSIWAGDFREPGQTVLAQLRLVDGAWRATRTDCPAGGVFVVVTGDGAVWTGGFGYSGRPGLARYDGRTCTAIRLPGGSPLPDVVALAAGPAGELAVAAFDPPYSGGDSDRAVLAIYNGTTASTLTVATLPGWTGPMFFDGSGDLWVRGMPEDLVRWHHANGDWVEAPATIALDLSRATPASGVSLAGDGTLWYLDASGMPQRVRL